MDLTGLYRSPLPLVCILYILYIFLFSLIESGRGVLELGQKVLVGFVPRPAGGTCGSKGFGLNHYTISWDLRSFLNTQEIIWGLFLLRDIGHLDLAAQWEESHSACSLQVAFAAASWTISQHLERTWTLKPVDPHGTSVWYPAVWANRNADLVSSHSMIYLPVLILELIPPLGCAYFLHAHSFWWSLTLATRVFLGK